MALDTPGEPDISVDAGAFEPRDDRYLKLLLILLVSATFFEG